MRDQRRVSLAGSFAHLARAADKARDTMLVPKEALETPPLEITPLVLTCFVSPLAASAR